MYSLTETFGSRADQHRTVLKGDEIPSEPCYSYCSRARSPEGAAVLEINDFPTKDNDRVSTLRQGRCQNFFGTILRLLFKLQ